MTKEWSEDNKFNPFNSWKDLVHADHFEAILKRKPKPPIVINFDLTNVCNYNCRFCMFANRERTDPTGKEFRGNNAILPEGYALRLPKLWKKWGVKAVCLGGGGEPSCHPDCLKMIEEIGKAGLDLGFVTNGYLVNNRKLWEDICNNCKWVGFSIDAGNEFDYVKTKGVPKEYFGRVINNLKKIAETKERLNSKVNVGYKFLIDEENWGSIYEACRIAKKIGCNTFQCRPAISDYQFSEKEIDSIWGQIQQAQKDFETKDFKIMGIKHKFNPNLTKKHDFPVCRATMMTSTWCADGKVYLCTDTRGNPWAYLCKHYPDPKKVLKYWGSKAHWKKVNKINFHKNCDRCTLAPSNEFFEYVFVQDKMERNLI